MKPSKIIFSIILLVQAFTVISQNDTSPPNILFIAVDDLRPDLGSYGNELIKTPNMDKLAKESKIFKNHYVQVPTCGASRYNLLTGMLPRTKKELSNNVIREKISGNPERDKPETFIHHLHRNGYYTVGMGKISHYIDGLYGYNDNQEGAPQELPHSWDEMVFDAGKWGNGWNAFFGYADGSNRQNMDKKVKPYEKADVDDEGYPDGLTSKLAVEKLKAMVGKEKPFFMGVGFFKPHLPFTAPKKYWDMYNESEIPLTSSPSIPINVSPESLHNSGEFNQYLLGEEKASLTQPISDEYARKLKHAYYASVSYVDAQVGKVLDELERLGLAENTIVVLWGDHGWQLGDHRVWGKHTLFEKALHSPLIMKVPGMNIKNTSSEAIVSTIDIYPTLLELCGVDQQYETDGKSFVKLLENSDNKEWENVSYSYYNDGISLRTKRYRITRYYRQEEPKIELYDHVKDPYENINIAKDHPEIVEKLMPLLQKGNLGIF